MGAAKCPSKGTQKKTFEKTFSVPGNSAALGYNLKSLCCIGNPSLLGTVKTIYLMYNGFTINTELFENLVSVIFGQGRFCWREQHSGVRR